MDRGKCILSYMRVFSYWLIVICVLVAPLSVQAELSDIGQYPYKSSIDLLEARGIVNGYPGRIRHGHFVFHYLIQIFVVVFKVVDVICLWKPSVSRRK